MPADATAHVRIARPSRDLQAAERFWITGSPTAEDLLVVYLNEAVPGELVERLEGHGGTRVPAHNPYWDTWGVTIEDPDGYRLVLSTRDWSNS
ncbi:hypothetical protein [Phytomonospora endophytica]|uniref:Ribosome biogenesis protein Nip4 n=1 Tax=Phytomonospora endophytica TaxID=714109 RepID=A0A841FWK5_9ACTN|nr:hypothetical protein [Phytomonospora endophytica]MBB6039133.1 ribosome biogenesis protein Nip4 [Phytomonospora endophytica]